MANERNVRNDEEQFQIAFGELSHISRRCGERIYNIKNNIPDTTNDLGPTHFSLGFDDSDCFTDLAWELFGRYIANNTHLLRLDLNDASMTASDMSIFFRELAQNGGGTLKELQLIGNEVDIDGVRSMVPFIQSSQNLSKLYMSNKVHIGTEEFEMLINALDGGRIEELFVNGCKIDDTSSLGNCTLSHLRVMNLAHNNLSNMGDNMSALENYTNLEHLYLMSCGIGREGCIVISNLMQKEDSRLKVLNLDFNDIDDEGAEILTASLKHNNSLKHLSLIGNNILEEKGCLAFLKLLIDVSSIESTYNSNHTLTNLVFPYCSGSQAETITMHIGSAISTNRNSPDSAGKTKIINYQLNRQTRMQLALLQGVDSPYSSIFANIDPVALPDVLAFVGEKCGQKNLYCALVATAPELTSLINRKTLLQHAISNINKEFARLTAKRDELNKRMALLEMGDSKQSTKQSAEEKERTIPTGSVGRNGEEVIIWALPRGVHNKLGYINKEVIVSKLYRTQYTATSTDRPKTHIHSITFKLPFPLVSDWDEGFSPSSFLAVEGCVVTASLLFLNTPSLPAARNDKDSSKATVERM